MRAPVPRAKYLPVNLPVRFPRPRPRPANRRQASIAVLCLGAIFGAASLVAGAKYLVPPAPPPPVQAQSDTEIYTGSIQLAPSRENRCRRVNFDNRSGQMQDLGTVPCGAMAAAASDPQEQYWARSLGRISDYFRGR